MKILYPSPEQRTVLTYIFSKIWEQPITICRIIVIVVLAQTSISGCTFVTDTVQTNLLPERVLFSTPNDIETAVAGAYTAVQGGVVGANGSPLGAFAIIQGELRGEDMLPATAANELSYTASYTPFVNNPVQQLWRWFYFAINSSNIVIEGVRDAATKGIITPDQTRIYEAEGRFLRALCFHELLINFSRPFADRNGASLGILPQITSIKTSTTIDAAFTLRRTSVADCYRQILEDLDFAEAALPVTRTGTARVVRATRGAAIALKTRIKLHQQDWAGVVTEANKLVPATAPFISPLDNYALGATSSVPFTNQTSSEAMFSIGNTAQNNPGAGNSLAPTFGSPLLRGRGLVRVSPLVFNLAAWRMDDARRTLLVQDGRSYYITKYSDYTGLSDYTPLLRYAEVLLNAAEAIQRQSNTPDTRALTLLNAVRNRAVPDSARFTANSFAAGQALLGAILAERRIEFLGEGKRWADIHRLALDPVFGTGGIPAKMSFGDATFATYNAVRPPMLTRRIAAIPYTDFRFVMPLPAEDVTRSPSIEQNPGY
jgi:hypothetical protein